MKPDVNKAISLLEQAIALHVKHMNGSAPTTGAAGMASQMKMMEQMRGALRAIKPSGLLGMAGM